MEITFEAIGLDFEATLKQSNDVTQILALTCCGNDALFLLDSPVCVEAIFEAARDAADAIDPAEIACITRGEQRREERRCSCS